MQSWFLAPAIDDRWLSAWGLALLAGALVTAVPFLLPKGRRLKVRGPFLALCLALIFHVIRLRVSPGSPVWKPYTFLAHLLVMISIGRSLYLIGFQSIVTPVVLRSLPRIILDIIQGMIFLLAGVVALLMADVPLEQAKTITEFAAIIAAFIGFMARHTIENIIAGLAIQLERPFEVLDWIEWDHQVYQAQGSNNIGKVLEINWRATRVITLDDVEVTIPNALLAQVAIRNYTKPKRSSRRSLYVVTPYNVPSRVAQRVILESVRDSWGVEKTPKPSVVTNAFTERGVEHWVRIFTKEFGRRDKVDGMARDRIWYGLKRAGISIPGPIRRVELKDVNRAALEQEEQIRIDERKQALKGVDFLEELSDDQFDTLASTVQLRHYSEGEAIVRQDGQDSELFILKSGEVAVTTRRPDGSVLELNRLGPTQFFGEVSFMTGQPRTATIVATRDCEIFVVDKDSFQPVLAKSPNLVEHISEVLATRQAEFDNRTSQHESDVPEAITARKRDLLHHVREFFSI